VPAFGKWKELGRTINKGEKGIAILAPMSFKSKELKEQTVKDSNGNQVYNADGTEKKEKVEVEQTSIGFKKVYVFDVSQTSGEPIPEYVHELNEAVEDEHVEAVINAVHDITGIPVDFENISSGAKGYYSYGEQRIVIQENLSGAQAVKTAIHECAHACCTIPIKSSPRRILPEVIRKFRLNLWHISWLQGTASTQVITAFRILSHGVRESSLNSLTAFLMRYRRLRGRYVMP
jgi:hypothetical protein